MACIYRIVRASPSEKRCSGLCKVRSTLYLPRYQDTWDIKCQGRGDQVKDTWDTWDTWMRGRHVEKPCCTPYSALHAPYSIL